MSACRAEYTSCVYMYVIGAMATRSVSKPLIIFLAFVFCGGSLAIHQGGKRYGVTGNSSSVPLPTADVLAWTQREIGAFFSFNMITMLTNVSNTQYFCIGVGGSIADLPHPDVFNPEALAVNEWLATASSLGAKYAVLTAQHCSGFSMWPTNIYDETGFNYTYSTRYSSFRGGGYDIVEDFVHYCRQFGIKPGLYYSLNQNYYLNVGHGVVQKTLHPGQVNVSQELYGKIVLAQMRELWTKYGELSEIWFDGGCSVPGISDEINSMLKELQPHAVYFGGCAGQNNIRWVGTESGVPNYPIWSTADNCASGQGTATGNVFCPAETDTTLQQSDHWFWRPNFPIRSLEELQEVYYHSVGQNTNLLLNMPANSSGQIEFSYHERYSDFGSWISKCFGSAVAETSGTGYSLNLSTSTSFLFNKMVISEDQSQGEAVLEFAVSALLVNGSKMEILSGQAVGHKYVRDIGSTVNATEVVLDVSKSFYKPVFSKFSIHYC